MSHITENEDVVHDESGNVPPPAKKTKEAKKIEEAGGSRPTKAKEPTKKKAKAKKLKDMTCVETCQPGPRSGCTIRGKGKPAGNLSCAEVDRQLEALDVSTKYASLCLKSAIQKGLIKIKGENKEEDLAQVVHSEKHDSCGHTINATLGDLLMQPDYAGTDYEDGSMEATVVCKECEEDEAVGEYEASRTYVTGLCEGRPSFDCGKFHNHCCACPGFGMCIHDYREAHCEMCGSHYFAGLQGFPCDCQPSRDSWDEGTSDESD
jgi:hypothetical protein